VLRRLCDLFALWTLEKQVGVLFEGGYFTAGEQSKALKHAVVELCAAVKVGRGRAGRARRAAAAYARPSAVSPGVRRAPRTTPWRWST